VIRKARPQAAIELKPGKGGDFIVTVDDREIWNKRRQDDEFPRDDQILDQL
jgi:predicted Rdx family selenoprotein